MSTAKTSDVTEQIEQLRLDIATLTQTVKQLALENIRTSAEHLRDTASSAAHKSADASQDALKDATRLVEDTARDLESRVRQRPLTAMLVALGAGFVLGLITRR